MSSGILKKQPIPDEKKAGNSAKHCHPGSSENKREKKKSTVSMLRKGGKGKAHKRYEFGCKVSVAATSRGGWFVGAMAVHGNPYDGHTLADTLAQVKRIAKEPLHVFVDRGYRGHDYQGSAEVHVDKPRRGRTAKSLWRWMKRRAAILNLASDISNKNTGWTVTASKELKGIW